MQLTYTYADELQALTSSVKVKPLYKQRLAMVNDVLASELQIPAHFWQPENWQSALFDPNSDWQKKAVAQKYGGHQFGHWNPHLGDGRGHLLAEIVDRHGVRHDLHLKGAGDTPYSRHADGRAVLRSSIREYMVSEAMCALGIPTSRALCLFTSEDPVQREQLERGAMLIRTCPSHIRFGHFEYYHHSQQIDALKSLFDYCFTHLFKTQADAENPYLALFDEIVSNTASMIANWQAIGFNHGVMNTDNMSIHGITFDYGPYAFLDDYIPSFVCNHSDHTGRYAFDQQPSIALWNLNALAQAFTPYLSVEQLTSSLQHFQPLVTRLFHAALMKKMGLNAISEEHPQYEQALSIQAQWLAMLKTQRRDYTVSFRLLQHAGKSPEKIIDHFVDRAAASNWLKQYLPLTERCETDFTSLATVNPAVIPRNHHLQQAISAAEQDDFSMCEALFTAISTPFDPEHDSGMFASAPPESGKGIALSCSS